MMNIYEREIKEYNELNKVAKKYSVVIFGSSFAKNIPASELAGSYNMDCDIYNRSINDLSVFDAPNVIEKCIADINPCKIIIQLGETDLAKGYKTISEIADAYKKLIIKIKDYIDTCEIIITSVCNSETPIYPSELNSELSSIALNMKCKYADITAAETHKQPYIRAFEMLKPYIRTSKLSFFDAMNMVHI